MSHELIFGLVSAVLNAILGSMVIVELIRARSGRKQVAADATSTVASSASKLVESMRTDLDGLRKEARDARNESFSCQKMMISFESELKLYKMRVSDLEIELSRYKMRVAELEAEAKAHRVLLVPAPTLPPTPAPPATSA